jgi:glycosyltransferase involved in cell wall biosynthesis
VAATIKLHRSRSTWSDHLSRAVALTDFAGRFLEVGGIPSDRISVIPNFVADPGPRARPASASDTVLFVGRLTPEKGIELLIRSWQEVAGAGMRLVVIGDGPLYEQMRSLAPSSVSFLGRLEPSSVSEWMLASRAIVVPSTWYEVQPLVILEALAAGLPIVVSSLGALRDSAGSAGVPYSAGDASELGERLLALVEPTLVDGLSASARREFESRFTEPVALANRERLYVAVRSGAG